MTQEDQQEQEPVLDSEILVKNNNRSSEKLRVEKALMGYQVAVDLWMNQGNQVWSRFNVMLVVNSIFIAAISLTSNQNQQSFFSMLLSIAGASICFVWLIFIRREAAYADYFVMSARELEEMYLADTIQTIKRGGDFAEGQTVKVWVNGEPSTLQMTKWASIFRARTIANWILFILIFVYVTMFIRYWL